MIVNSAAKKLIKEFEGLRLKAYLCSAGVLTIGWGHTSSAGEPAVRPGMTISRAEAIEIFNRDIQEFAEGVERLIKVDITENQFGACVSLAFNIGIGAFSKSSVLRFVNKRRFDDAADAFLLFNKERRNGKKVVSAGLVRRRAAEAALFKSDDGEDGHDVRIPVEPEGKKPLSSTTNIAAGITAAAGVSAATKEVVDNTSSIFSSSNMIMVGLAFVIVAGAAWIIRERWLKSRDWAV